MAATASPSAAELLAGPAAGPLAVRDEQIKQLKRQLQLKQFELKTVLEVAHEVMARQFIKEDLLRLLSLTLQGQRNVEHVLLLAREPGGGTDFKPLLSLGQKLDTVAHLTVPAAILTHAAVPCVPLAGLNLEPEWAVYKLAIPILRQSQAVAYVFVGGLRLDYDEEQQEQLVEFIRSLTNIVVGAIENLHQNAQRVLDAAVRKEIEIAQEVQAMLFPRQLPNDAHLAIERSYVPHTEVGGDYYDVIEIDPDRLLLCVADVSGKGVPASLLMSNFQAGLRTLLRQGVELATIVPELNHLLFRNSGGEKFITAFLGIYDRRSRRLHYVNAGHNAPFLLADDGTVQPLPHGTVMLGIMEDLPMLQVGEVTISPRSLLLLYTDGLTEVFDANNNEFGEEGVLAILRGNRYLPLPKLHQELLATIAEFSANDAQFADDVTILSCRFK